MRLTWMLPAALFILSSASEASAQARPMGFTVARDLMERPRVERPRVERPQLERLPMGRVQARAEIVGAVERGAARAAPQTAAAPRGGLAPAVEQRVQSRADVEGVRSRTPGERREQPGRGQPGQVSAPGAVGSFRIAEGRMKQVIRCGEGSDACGTTSREAPLSAPQATGGAARLLKAAAPFAALRDSVNRTRSQLQGKLSPMAFLCAVAQVEACNK